MFRQIFEMVYALGYLVLAPVAIWALGLGAMGWLVYATFWALAIYLRLLASRRDDQLNAIAHMVDALHRARFK